MKEVLYILYQQGIIDNHPRLNKRVAEQEFMKFYGIPEPIVVENKIICDFSVSDTITENNKPIERIQE